MSVGRRLLHESKGRGGVGGGGMDGRGGGEVARVWRKWGGGLQTGGGGGGGGEVVRVWRKGGGGGRGDGGGGGRMGDKFGFRVRVNGRVLRWSVFIQVLPIGVGGGPRG